MKISIIVFHPLIFLLILSGCENTMEVATSGKIVKIGVIAPLSGNSAVLGKNGIAGVKAALSLHPVLLNGDRVELIIEDDYDNVEQTRESLKKLVEIDRVTAILTFSKSEILLELVNDIETLKIPVLALLASHPEISTSWITQFFFDDHLQATVSALYVLDELLIDRAGVVLDMDDPHSVYLAKQFTTVFKSAGGEVQQEVVSSGDKNFKDNLTKLMGSGAQFCYYPLKAEDILLLLRQGRDLGWSPKILVSDGILSQVRLMAADQLDLIDGMLAVDSYANNIPLSPLGEKLSTRFHADMNQPGTTYSASGAEGIVFLLRSLEKCGDSSDKNCVNEKLRNNEYYQGIIGNLRIMSNGKTERPIFINRIAGEELEFVVKIN